MRKRIIHYKAGELQPEEKNAVETHISQCVDCKAKLENWTEWDKNMEKDLHALIPPPYLQENVLATLRDRGLMKQETGDLIWHQFAGRTLALFFAVYLAILLGVLLYLSIIFGWDSAETTFLNMLGAGWSQGLTVLDILTAQGKRFFLGNLSTILSLAALTLSWLLMAGWGLYHNLSHWEKSH